MSLSLLTYLRREFYIILWRYTQSRKASPKIRTTGKYCSLLPGCDKVPAAEVGSQGSVLLRRVVQEPPNCRCKRADSDIGVTSSCMF